MRAIAVIPAAGLLAGAAAGILLPDVSPSLAWALIVAAGVGALAALWRLHVAWLACFVAVGFGAGGWRLASDAWRQARYSSLRLAFDRIARAQRAEAVSAGRVVPEDPSAFAFVEGTLRADASVGPAGVSLSVDVDRIRAPDGDGTRPARTSARQVSSLEQPVEGGLIASVGGALAPGLMRDWRAGRRVRFPADLRRPARYLDPGVPDAERALQMRGTSLLGSVKSGALVDVLTRAGWLDERLADVRAVTRREIADAVGRWSARSAGIVTAIVIGDRAGLDDEVQRRLQEAGTYHVIAISGGNIAILAGLMLGAFRVSGVLGRAAMIASIVLLALYSRLVGGGASVDRATLMAITYLAARVVDQRSPPLNALAVVAACLVALEPLSIADPAFILTFGATLGILLVAPLTSGERGRRLPRWLAPLAAMLAASVATEALLLPVGAMVFSRVTFAGLALNFLAIPLMAVAQIAGMLLVPAALVGRWAAIACGFVAHLGAAGLVHSAELVGFVPAVVFRVAAPGWPAVILYYLALALLVSGRARLVSAVTALAAGTWIVAEPWTYALAAGDGHLHVTFLDVGQGDSAFVRFPRGETMLVDTGGLVARPAAGGGTSGASGFDIGDRVVAPPLRLAGVRRLDRLVLTHGDPDHIGGAPSLLGEFRPHEVWEGIPVPRFEPLTTLHAAAGRLGVPWKTVTAGLRLSMDGVDVRVLHPEPADWERQRVRNDDSVVIDIRWGDVSVLLTGDIGRAVERRLAGDLLPSPMRIVKVPHHGSLTSSSAEFVRALRPRVAVFSVGRSNRFGHPAPEVLDRYFEAGTAVFRTDRDGAVTIDSDGRSIDVRTFNGRETMFRGPP